MNSVAANTNVDCRSHDIAAYIDGELSPDQEMQIEMHLAACRTCADEMNQQKEFLCVLDSSLKSESELELPKNFTKVVVTNAESRVNGLRRPTERLNALFICVALLFFVLFTLGAEAKIAFGNVWGIFEQVAAVSSFASHFVYDIAVGAVVIVRSLSAQVPPGSLVAAFLFAGFIVSLFALSRLVLRYHRT